MVVWYWIITAIIFIGFKIYWRFFTDITSPLIPRDKIDLEETVGLFLGSLGWPIIFGLIMIIQILDLIGTIIEWIEK